MITNPILHERNPQVTPTPTTNHDRVRLPSLCWKAVFGGTIAAIGIHILLTALGMGAGLATFSPITDANPVATFSLGAALIWTLCALIALSFGGFLAGRFSHSIHSGFTHGVLVWSLTLIITALLLTTGTGMVLGGALKVLGEGMGIGGKAVAGGTTEVVKEGAKRGADQVSSFIDEAVQSSPTNGTPQAAIQAKREIGFAVTKLFAPGNDVSSPDNRVAAIKSLVTYAKMSETDATQTVDGWITSYKNLKAELAKIKDAAEVKAREAADHAASNLSQAAIVTFFALLLGLLATAFSGSYGGKCAMRHADPLGMAVG